VRIVRTNCEELKVKTVEISVYSFDELSDAAKEAAREWYRQGAIDTDWYEYTFGWIKEAGACLGIEVEDIQFSGFYNQGSGASFAGSYRYKKGWRKALTASFTGHTLDELTTIGEALQRAQAPHFYRARVTIHRTARHFDLDVDCESGYNAQWDDLHQALRDFASWIYSALEAEYEYLLSDTSVDEMMTANEYQFTENGSIWA